MRSFRSIGEELNIPEKQVQRIHDKAMLKLQRWLEEHPEEATKVRLLLEQERGTEGSSELLRVLYDGYGRSCLKNGKVW